MIYHWKIVTLLFVICCSAIILGFGAFLWAADTRELPEEVALSIQVWRVYSVAGPASALIFVIFQLISECVAWKIPKTTVLIPLVLLTGVMTNWGEAVVQIQHFDSVDMQLVFTFTRVPFAFGILGIAGLIAYAALCEYDSRCRKCGQERGWTPVTDKDCE